MGCCGGRSGARVTNGKPSGCVLCKIWAVLTTEKTPDGEPCVVIPGHIAHKPDPCIYDQFLLMQLGKPVTWDNPDVRIFLGGVEQYTYNLTASTEYDVEITVHNASREKPANQTTVDIAWISFGAGAETRHPVTVASTDVPVWPGTSVVTTKWRTPDVPGHYCIEVVLSHPDDGNPSNNRGWNNTQVFAAQSPVERELRIYNRHPGDCPPVREGGGPVLRPHRVFLGWAPLAAVATLPLTPHGMQGMRYLPSLLALMLIGYVVGSAIGLFAESAYAAMARRRNASRARTLPPPRTDCHLVEIAVDSYEFEDKTGKEFDPAVAFKGRGAIWGAKVEPPSFVFLPGEAFRDVRLLVDAPDDPGPAGTFNVNVWQGGVPSGGATFTITTGG
ncbi:hypothetical protein [Mangrovibrevibacter kandeliae]|uniref:hypothetical protein n=1 Tax=Mangrovibrevibacter kandeliae TaxID=2968473 RepID=UPI002118FA15|nr:hypothetical protein [Aurantimonas sp. CSK15Z-1]MCQ8782495.1 hypothetical protein [Aurantimonas sp. CSK15Z-1]